MRSFTEAVKRDQEKQGLHVFPVIKNVDPEERELIDLIAMKNSITTFIRARGNGHGNLHPSIILRLKALGKQCGARVLHAKVNGEGDIVFFRIYER